MAEEKDNVTPEEKLLNVIQEGGKDEAASEATPEGAAEPAAKASPAPAAEPVAKDEAVSAADKTPAKDKPPLKVAARDEDKEQKEAGPQKQPAQDSAPAPAAPSLSSSKKKVGAGGGIRLLNRMLAAGVLILLGLCAVEAFLTIKARGSVKEPAALEMPEPETVVIELEDVRDAYAGDIWWRLEGVSTAGGSTTQTKTITVNTTPWQQTMKGHFKLVATSVREPKSASKAILVDSRDNSMYFVRLGKTFMVEGTEVTLDDLEADRARFTVGSTSIEMK